jgi:hypothetical protein
MAQQKQTTPTPVAPDTTPPADDHDDGIVVDAKAPPTPEEVRGWNIHQRMFHAADLISMVGKSKFNSFHKYKYASHDDVVAKVRQAFQLCGILCVTDITDYRLETQQMPDDSGKVKYQTLATLMEEVSFINPDDPQDRYVIHVPAYSYDTSDKAIGKAISYAKKYALVALSGLMLATGDDADQDHHETDAMERARQSAKAPAPVPAQPKPAAVPPKPARPQQAQQDAKPAAPATAAAPKLTATQALTIIATHEQADMAKLAFKDVDQYGNAMGYLMGAGADAVKTYIEAKTGKPFSATPAPHVRALVTRWRKVYAQFCALKGLAKHHCGVGHDAEAKALLDALKQREGWVWGEVAPEVVEKRVQEIEKSGVWQTLDPAPAADAAQQDAAAQ